MAKMTEEMKLLLKLLLEQEEQGEAGQNVVVPSPRAKASLKAEQAKLAQVEKQNREADMQNARRELYASHEPVLPPNPKEVPIWEKYALTTAEASQYFHIGYKKLKAIINKDKYAKYLIWQGGRVFIKRKLFEEWLNNEIEV